MVLYGFLWIFMVFYGFALQSNAAIWGEPFGVRATTLRRQSLSTETEKGAAARNMQTNFLTSAIPMLWACTFAAANNKKCTSPIKNGATGPPMRMQGWESAQKRGL